MVRGAPSDTAALRFCCWDFFWHVFNKFLRSHWIVIECLNRRVRIMLLRMVSDLFWQVKIQKRGPPLWRDWIWCEKELLRVVRACLPREWEVFLLWWRQLRTLIDPISYAQTSHQCRQEWKYLLRHLLRGHPWWLSFVYVSPSFQLVYFNGASWLHTEECAVVFQLL